MSLASDYHVNLFQFEQLFLEYVPNWQFGTAEVFKVLVLPLYSILFLILMNIAS